ncbi:hypothetical protein L195_g044491, partial [Trifolium pratense]
VIPLASFYSLVPQAENAVVHVDCVISNDDFSSSTASSDKSLGFSGSFFA